MSKLALSLTITLAAAALLAQAPGEPKKTETEKQEPHFSIQRALDGLFGLEKYDELVKVTNFWRTRSEDIQKRLILAFLKSLDSDRPLKIDDRERLFLLKEDETEAGPAAKGKIVVRHDLLIEGGRAAWAIERLLVCRLPAVRAGMTEAERKKLKATAYERVIQAMSVPDDSWKLIATAEPQDLIKLASGKDTDPRMLTKLALVKSASVRKAVAANLRTPIHIVRELASDPDAAVREAAEENRRTSRPITPCD